MGFPASPLDPSGRSMRAECPRCGATKTESVPHGLIYDLCWGMGYHLRRCSRCNRRRLLPRGDPSRPHPNDLTIEQLQTSFNKKVAASGGRQPAQAWGFGDTLAAASADGAPEVRTSLKTVEQRREPAVAPKVAPASVAEPAPVEGPAAPAFVPAPAPPQLAEAAPVERPAELAFVRQQPSPRWAPPAEVVDDYHVCPQCGSSSYRRSRRRWWERMINRPRMARCMKCNHRFPYPR